MLLFNLIHNPALAIIYILAIGLALSGHEAAHAWVADKLGDPTAKLMGRTTLNPLAHLDPIGTVLLLIVGFGWGKPVPVDEHRLRHKYDIVLVALAGPASNLVMATILGIVFRLTTNVSLQNVLTLFIALNLGLMLFNLIPIPPLDGSKILRLVISPTAYQALERYGFILILALFILVQGGAGNWLTIAISSIFHLLTGKPLLV